MFCITMDWISFIVSEVKPIATQIFFFTKVLENSPVLDRWWRVAFMKVEKDTMLNSHSLLVVGFTPITK